MFFKKLRLNDINIDDMDDMLTYKLNNHTNNKNKYSNNNHDDDVIYNVKKGCWMILKKKEKKKRLMKTKEIALARVVRFVFSFLLSSKIWSCSCEKSSWLTIMTYSKK